MTFSTREFEAVHGRQPRGYGMWGFAPAAEWNADGAAGRVMWYTGTFANAKKSARAYYAERGVSSVVVCP